MVAQSPGQDFFISYNSKNRSWAEGIAVQLEAAGYTTTLQRFGPDEQPVPARAGQQPCEPGQHGSVGPVRPRPGRLASQHGDLVAQYEQFGGQGRRTPRQQRKPP
jgi:hypothetical protein